ncbi:ATP-binding protein [Acidobacteria bacterium AB60]|nr:ATP-binding protein [Acidobacteria bacterium AB60]
MAEDRKEQRPVRKLTVKNFSVIKEAELEFGKITVLIGPQASGKSLLCKLAYFLGREILFKAEDWAKQRLGLQVFEDALKRDFEARFPRSGWGSETWTITWVSNGFGVKLHRNSTSDEPFSVSFGGEFTQIYREISTSQYPDPIDSSYRFRGLAGTGVWDRATYIPSERTYFVDTSKGYSSMASDPDPLVKAFAPLFEASRLPEISRPRTKSLLQGDFVRGADGWMFAFNDGRELPLNQLSSGSKELLPLLSVLEMYELQRPSSVASSKLLLGRGLPEALSFDDFFIEEPEAHVFPDTQQHVVRYLAQLVNRKDLRVRIVITTHSPYLLTAFNELLSAGMAAKARPDRIEEIKKIVPQECWMDEGELLAYAFNGVDGKLHPMMDAETGLINGDVLDNVSDQIGSEFEELLDIEYGH